MVAMDKGFFVNTKPRSTPAGRAVKAAFIVGVVIITCLTMTGLGIFEQSLWIAQAVFAAIEVASAVVLFTPRWRNIPAAIAFVFLAIYQAGQSYFYEIYRATSSDPVIAIDIFGVLFLGALIIILIINGPTWPRRINVPR